MPQKIKFVYVTAPNIDEALKIGRALVQERLAACANIIDGVRSIYRWEGNVVDEKEVVLVLKTVESKVEAVSKKIKSIHSYDCPCIVALEITGGNDEFIKWVASETA